MSAKIDHIFMMPFSLRTNNILGGNKPCFSLSIHVYPARMVLPVWSSLNRVASLHRHNLLTKLLRGCPERCIHGHDI